MESTQQYPGTERGPDSVSYHRADCTGHPDPDRPRRHDSDHFRCRSVVIGGDPVDVRTRFEEVVPESCGCGDHIESDFRVVEWPAIPMTADAALSLFRRTDGCVVLRIRPLSYPEDPVDWQSMIGVDNPTRDRDWYLGLIGDRIVTRTRIDHAPIWSATSADVDQLGVLLRQLPSRPKPIWDTPMTALLEDYQAGHRITAGTSAPVSKNGDV